MDKAVYSILTAVCQECSKLEAKGHDYFIVLFDQKQVAHFGSHKGRQFLEDNTYLIHKFLDHCHNTSVDKVSKASESSYDTFTAQSRKTRNRTGHAKRTKNARSNNMPVVVKCDMVSSKEKENLNDTEINIKTDEGDDSGEENDFEIEQTFDTDPINGSENTKGSVVTESGDLHLDDSFKDDVRDFNDEKDAYNGKDDKSNVISGAAEATENVAAEESEKYANNFLQQINLTPIKKTDTSQRKQKPVQADVLTGETGVKRSNRLKIKREMRDNCKQMEEVKSAKKPKLEKRKLVNSKGLNKEKDTKIENQEKEKPNLGNVILMPVKVKLSGTEKVQDGLRVCNPENQSQLSEKIQKVKIVKMFVNKGNQEQALESICNSGNRSATSSETDRRVSTECNVEATEKSPESAEVSTKEKEKPDKKVAKSAKLSTAGKAKHTKKSAESSKVPPKGIKTKMIRIEKSESNDYLEDEPESDVEDEDKDGIALYESKVKDTSWTPKKRNLSSPATSYSGKRKKRGKKKQFECEKCGKSTDSKGAYTQHMTVHTLKQCKYCCETPKNEADKKRHQMKCSKRAYLARVSQQRSKSGKWKFSCDVCKRVCLSAATLERHKVTHVVKIDCDARLKVYHDKEKGKCCTKCGRLFCSEGSYLNHMEVHQDDDVLRCFYCGDNFDSDDVFMKHLSECDYRRQCLNSDETSKTDFKLKCKMCDMEFTSQKSFHDHLLLIHFNKEHKFKCSICKKVLSNLRTKRNHEKLLHSNTKDHKCDICGKAMTTKSCLYRHKMIFHGLKNGKLWKCKKCGKEFKCKLYLDKHMPIHSFSKIHQCQICSKLFGSVEYLKSHLKYTHVAKNFICEICGKGYKKNSYLIDHIRVIHSGARPFACEFCEKRFQRKCEYNVHRMIHTGEKPNICEICGEGFSQTGNLRKHQKSVHPQETDEVFTCEICGKSARLIENYYAHMRLHMIKLGKVEEVGNKRYGKFYQCEICSRYFAQAGRLTQHLRSHTGERPFSCIGCNRCYISSSKLNRHLKLCKSLPPDAPRRSTVTEKSIRKDKMMNANVDKVNEDKLKVKVDNVKVDKRQVDKLTNQSQVAAVAVENLVASQMKDLNQEQSLTENEEGVLDGVIESVADVEAQTISSLMENAAAAGALTENNTVHYVNVNPVTQRFVFVVNEDDVGIQQGTEYVVIDSTAEDIPL